MRLFSVAEAQYYFSAFNNSRGISQHSIDDFRYSILGSHNRILHEGTTIFNEYRDLIIREIERELFFSVSFYRRSLDLLFVSSASLAQMTMYYGSWYASHALLAMFGSYIYKGKYYIDVNRSTPHHQQLNFQRVGSTPASFRSSYSGSHQIFWDYFYECTKQLIPIIDPKYNFVLSPISGNPIWQIENRNLVNYDLFYSLLLSKDFETNFSSTNFPACLSGTLGTQFQILSTLIEIVFNYFQLFGINSDSLTAIGQIEPLKEKINHLVIEPEIEKMVNRIDISFLN